MPTDPTQTALLSLLADIRAAVGDPLGRLMQDELVQHCRQLLQRAQRGETLLEQVRLTLIECGHNCDEQTLHRHQALRHQALKHSPTMPTPTGTEAAVCADIAQRQQLGIAKYRTTVADNPLPLRQWLQHAYEETLDLPIYLRRAIDEIDHPLPLPTPAELVSKAAQMTRPEVQAAIDACHPCTLETDESYAADALAMELIHERHDKRDIVNMIRWVLMGCPPVTPSPPH